MVAVAAYLAAAICLVCATADRLNPDAIAYIQIARHYAGGRLDLAVNGWFGPLLSWLLVPAVWLKLNMVVFVRSLGAVAGLGFAIGAAVLARRAAGKRWTWWAFAAALVLALGAVGDEITPDLLLACGLTWFFALSIRLVYEASPGRALAAGLVGGACYMIKAYALPVVAVDFVIVFLIRRALVKRNVAYYAPAAWPVVAAVAGIILGAGPWFAVLGVKAGGPCISTTGCSNRSWGPLPLTLPLPVHLLQHPCDGRITNWENPVEIPHPWPQLPACDAAGKIGKCAEIVAKNIASIAVVLKSADVLGLLLISLIVAMLLAFPLRHALGRRDEALRLALCLGVLLYLGGFVVLWFFERFLWPAWGLLLAISFSLLERLSHAGESAAAATGDPSAAALPAAAAARPLRWFATSALAAILILSIAGHVAMGLDGESGVWNKGAQASWLRRTATQLGLRPHVAANRWYDGLFASYWTNSQFLGEPAALPADLVCTEVPPIDVPKVLADQLAPFGPSSYLVFDDLTLAEQLKNREGFTFKGSAHDPSLRRSVYVFDFDPVPPPAPSSAPTTMSASTATD